MKKNFIPDQAGELVVTGIGVADIPLHPHQQPERLHVEFKDHRHEPVPCNPQHSDSLEWDLHYKHSRYVLVIKWNVSALREIVWSVRY